MLQSTVNTHKVEREVLRAARDKFNVRGRFVAFFEHGQWWIEDLKTSAQYSVVDTNRGFDFEQVTQGNEEN